MEIEIYTGIWQHFMLKFTFHLKKRIPIKYPTCSFGPSTYFLRETGAKTNPSRLQRRIQLFDF